MSTVNAIVPFATAAGVIVAAIITGFGAATLKHRWDVKAEDLRWKRERSERRRDQVWSAFTGYLASRNGFDRALFLATRDRNMETADGVSVALADYFRSLSELQIILDDRSFLAMEEEIKSFPAWTREMNEGLFSEESPYKPPPDSQSVIKLAQKLIRDQ